MFSPEFLDNVLISSKEKAYMLSIQQFMYKESGEGKISYNKKELSKKINLSESLISKRDKDLENKGYLLLQNDYNKTFNLGSIGQAIVFTLQKHDNEISQLKRDKEELENRVNKLEKLLNNNGEIIV